MFVIVVAGLQVSPPPLPVRPVPGRHQRHQQQRRGQPQPRPQLHPRRGVAGHAAARGQVVVHVAGGAAEVLARTLAPTRVPAPPPAAGQARVPRTVVGTRAPALKG